MKISQYLRFKAKDQSHNIYELVSESRNIRNELLKSDSSIELHFEPGLDEIFIMFSGDVEIAEVCFPETKFCYGHFEGSNDLIIGRRLLKETIIELIVLQDQIQYSHIHYQALRNGEFRAVIKALKNEL